MSSDPTAPTEAPARRDRGPLLVLGAIALSLALLGGRLLWRLSGGAREPLPVLAELPPFDLSERGGRTIGDRDLRGRVWVAGFIFTRCTGMCPQISATMRELQGRLAGRRLEDLRLVSISVDPGYDSLPVLDAYAREYGADPARWWFVTGERDALYHLIRDGFRLAVAERPDGAPPAEGELITHTDRLVLVDRELRVRGYYHATEPGTAARLATDARRLDREGR